MPYNNMKKARRLLSSQQRCLPLDDASLILFSLLHKADIFDISPLARLHRIYIIFKLLLATAIIPGASWGLSILSFLFLFIPACYHCLALEISCIYS